jgi:hypothetical protein
MCAGCRELFVLHVSIVCECCFVQDGYTALLIACRNGYLAVAQWLVSSAGSSAVTERNNVRAALWSLCEARGSMCGVYVCRMVKLHFLWRVDGDTWRSYSGWCPRRGLTQ